MEKKVSGHLASKGLKRSITAALLAALAAAPLSYGVSAESEMHYVSIKSNNKGADSNYGNDGAQAENSIAIGPSVKTMGEDNIVIGSGEIVSQNKKNGTSFDGKRVLVIGHGNYFQPTSDWNGQPVRYRDAAIIGHSNRLLQGDKDDAGGGTPAYQIVHGWENTLKGSFTGAIGYGNEIKNSSRPGHTSQSMAFTIGTGNTIDATGYYMGDKNRVNSLPDYKEPGSNPNTVGADLYVIGRHNIIGSSKGGEWYVTSGRIIGTDNVVYSNDANVFGWWNKVYASNGLAIGDGHRVGVDDKGNLVKNKNNQAIYNPVAVGRDNAVTGDYGVAVGNQAKSRGKKASAVGSTAYALSDYSTALGTENRASGYGSVAVGSLNNTYDFEAKQGRGTWEDFDSGASSSAMGVMNISTGKYSSAVGVQNKALGERASSFGYKNTTEGLASSSFGYSNQATERYGFAAGALNQASGQFSSAVGSWNQAEGRKSQAAGYRNFVSGYGAVALGSENNLNFVKQYQALGFVQTGDLSSALGISNVTAGRNSSGLGNSNYAFGTKSVGVGMSNYAMGYESLAIGHYSVAGDEDVNQIDRVKRSAAIGSRAKSAITDAVAIGSFSSATRDSGGYGYHPVLGKVATEADITKDANIGAYRTALETARTEWENSVVAAEKVLHKIHTQQYTTQGEYQQLATEYEKLNAESDTKRKVYDEAQKKVSDLVGAWQGQLAALSVGDETSGRTRQITGVAAGSEDTDAVNVAQLKALDQKIGESGVKYYGVNENVIPDIELGWEHLVIYDGKKELNADLAGKNIHGEGAQKNKGDGSMNANYGSMAAGYNAYTSHGFSTALGNETVAYEKSMAAGFASYARAESVALGVNAFAKDRSEAIGQYARADQEAIAIGYKATAGGFNKDEQTDKIPQAMTGIAIGKEAYAKGGMAFGNGAESLSLNAMAFGVRAKATGSGIALGYQAQANVSGGIAIGMNSRAEVGRGIKGYLAPGDIDNQTAAEKRTWISGGSAVSFGNIKLTRQLMNVAAGLEDTDAVNVAQLKALNTKMDQGAIHYYSVTSDKKAAGSNFDNDGAKADDSMVIGIGSTSEGINSTVVGNNNTLKGGQRDRDGVLRNNSIVAGENIEVDGTRNAVFATDYKEGEHKLTKVAGKHNTVIGVGNLVGYTAKADPENQNEFIYEKTDVTGSHDNVVVGMTNTVNGGSVVLGTSSEIKDGATLATSVGHANTIQGSEQYGVALGNNLLVEGYGAIAVGTDSKATADYATAIGTEAVAEQEDSIAFGDAAKAQNKYSIAFGSFATAKAGSGVAIGSSSLADREKGSFGYLAGENTSEVWKATRGAVSVGNKEKKYTRQITGVAAGTEDTDAVNVAQLKKVQEIAAAKTTIEAGDNITVAPGTTAGSYKISATDTTLQKGNNALSLDDSKLNLSVKDTAGNEVKGSVDLNAIKSAVDTNTYTTGGTYDAANKKLVFTQSDSDKNYEVDVSAMISDVVDTNTTYTMTGTKNAADNTTTISLKGSDGKEQTVTVATKDTNTYTTGGKYDAATKTIKFTRSDNATYDVDISDAVSNVTDTRNTIVDSDTVTVEAKAQADGSNEYKLNVKTDGKVEKDNKGVINGGTVYKETRIEKDGNYIKAGNTAGENLIALDKQVGVNSTNITKLENNIYDMGTRVGELDNRMNRVGAGAAALAALHPLDFDPEDKWDFAAGYGNYKGANAAAIGAYYRPNEDTMFSIGGSFGGGENMVNAGVSVKLGRGSEYMKLSRAEMAQKLEEQSKEIREMKAKDKERDAQMQEIMRQLELLQKQAGK